MANLSEVRSRLEDVDALNIHPNSETLLRVLTGETALTSAGYPFICESSFQAFIQDVPHLFQDGAMVLAWASSAESEIKAMDDLDEETAHSLTRAVKVLRNMVFTAAVTSPSDLWLLRQVIGIHHRTGFAEILLNGKPFSVEETAVSLGLQERQLEIDCGFLHARGFLLEDDKGFKLSQDPAMRDSIENLKPLPVIYQGHLVHLLREWLMDGAPSDATADFFTSFFRFSAPYMSPSLSWLPNRYQIELGYRLLPLVLSMRALGWTANFKRGATLPETIAEIDVLLAAAGMSHERKITTLGARVFQRGPGPFGIVGAYYPYMNYLEKILRGQETSHWVSRGENVAASQDANRKTFEAGNNALDDFLHNHADDIQLKVFIEHAVGKGEATRQRFERNGEESVRYFGADLEDAAIDEAVKQQKEGVLPANMRFIRNADIGVPEKVTAEVLAAGCNTQDAVMMVGNGFHEIRHQTNEKMLEVFQGYARAGIILIFTEETALSDQDLLQTAWNTYHAGFRYVHEMSGQGLRPSWESERAHRVWSWRKCAREAGYHVVDRYTTQTRTIYPTREPGRKNPSISVTYFCVPKPLAEKLSLD